MWEWRFPVSLKQQRSRWCIADERLKAGSKTPARNLSAHLLLKLKEAVPQEAANVPQTYQPIPAAIQPVVPNLNPFTQQPVLVAPETVTAPAADFYTMGFGEIAAGNA